MSKKHKLDNSPKVEQRDKIKNLLTIRPFNWSEKQKKFIELALDNNTKAIFVDGLWGSGKTAISIYVALQLLNQKKVSDIVYLRNIVESTSTGKIGFIPGDISDKISPYMTPLYDKLNELLPKNDGDKLLKEERVQCYPIGFIRGLSWNSKIIICDESSCLTKEDLFLVLSRIGEFSKILIIGDSLQNDIGNKSGFKDIFNLFNDAESKENGIYTFEFKDENDIVRSKLLRFLMKKIKFFKSNKVENK